MKIVPIISEDFMPGCFSQESLNMVGLGTGDAAGDELMKRCVHAAS